MKLFSTKTTVESAFCNARYYLTLAGIAIPVDDTPPGLIAFRLKVWNLIKAIRVNETIEVPLDNDPPHFVAQNTKDYRQHGWNVQLGFTAIYDDLGQAYTRNFLRIGAPETAEKLKLALEQVGALIPLRLREPERKWWQFW
jgi:hypothetical protein